MRPAEVPRPGRAYLRPMTWIATRPRTVDLGLGLP
jgi:hypothetical protein